jgi:SAM-dependent methyltransferase
MVSAMDLPLDAAPQERYVFKPLYGSSHYWALGRLQGTVAGKRVLDIGAGGGGIGRSIRPEKPAELVAVEVDPRAQIALKEVYEEVHAGVEPLSNRQFDTIILLDVLEHMVDPFGFLQTVQNLLAPGGQILISVPNVAHWSVRFPLLLLGRFEYRSRGILDRTHLQFFSRRRFKEMCASLSQCRVEQLGGSIEPVELVLPKWSVQNPGFSLVSRARWSLAQAFPGLMAYQHLALIRKVA